MPKSFSLLDAGPRRRPAHAAPLADKAVLGMGFASKADGNGAEDFICAAMARLGIGKLACIATLAKTPMPGFVQKLAGHFGNIPVLYYTSVQLQQQTARLVRPSCKVFQAVGCYGVAEAAALCAAGRQARIILEKTAFNGMSFALAGEKIS